MTRTRRRVLPETAFAGTVTVPWYVRLPSELLRAICSPELMSPKAKSWFQSIHAPAWDVVLLSGLTLYTVIE